MLGPLCKKALSARTVKVTLVAVATAEEFKMIPANTTARQKLRLSFFIGLCFLHLLSSSSPTTILPMENRQRVILYLIGLVDVVLLTIFLSVIFTPSPAKNVADARTLTAGQPLAGTPTQTPTFGPTLTPSRPFTPSPTATP